MGTRLLHAIVFAVAADEHHLGWQRRHWHFIPNRTLHVLSNSDVETALIENSSNAISASGLCGSISSAASASDSAGLRGVNAGAGCGVEGECANGHGLVGRATSTAPVCFGVYGETYSTSFSAGVKGEANSPTGDTMGVYGVSSSTSGVGVRGLANGGSGATTGVHGTTYSAHTEGSGVTGVATGGIGVRGYSYGSSGAGLLGEAGATSGLTRGVEGRVSSSDGYGVYGVNTQSMGTGAGIVGESRSPNGIGVYGKTQSGATGWGSAVRGEHKGTGNQGYGVHGTHAGSGTGVWGESDMGVGVYGRTDGGWAVVGFNSGGVVGYAGHFSGRVYVSGPLGVGLGMTNPNYLLQLNENSAAKPTSGSWTITSDERLKKNVHTIERALDKVLSLRGITYQWIDSDKHGGMEGTYTGLIAQEVERVFPEWIGADADGHKTLTVIGFEGVVVEAFRELRDELNARVAEKESRIAELEKCLARIEAFIAESATETRIRSEYRLAEAPNRIEVHGEFIVSTRFIGLATAVACLAAH